MIEFHLPTVSGMENHFTRTWKELRATKCAIPLLANVCADAPPPTATATVAAWLASLSVMTRMPFSSFVTCLLAAVLAKRAACER